MKCGTCRILRTSTHCLCWQLYYCKFQRLYQAQIGQVIQSNCTKHRLDREQHKICTHSGVSCIVPARVCRGQTQSNLSVCVASLFIIHAGKFRPYCSTRAPPIDHRRLMKRKEGPRKVCFVLPMLIIQGSLSTLAVIGNEPQGI